MQSTWLKKVLPHVVAIITFLLIAVLFCKPALESGKVMRQDDLLGFKGVNHDFTLHQEKYGTSPLWLTTSFSGMPAFTIGVEAPTVLTARVHQLCTLWLPEPFASFFLACICFYIFCLCLRINPYIGIIGSLAFAYSTYIPVIIATGHLSKMWALAYAPALLGGMILLYERKYFLGFLLTALFTMQEIGRNHQQISYYVLLIMGIATVVYLIKWIREKQYAHAFKAIGLVIVAGLLGVLTNSVNLFTTYDYTKYSKRGGQLILNEKDSKEQNLKQGEKTKGLSRDYAFQWSYGKTETFTLMFPGIMGYGALGVQLDENSAIAKFLESNANQSPDQAGQIAQSMSGALYWGDQPFTMGPVYLGAVVCFLFIFGLVYVKGVHKWWILAASIFGILLSWGSNFGAFNNFMFDHFPFYNKFRAPAMTLIIPQILFPILMCLGLQQLITSNNNKEEVWKNFKVSVIATGALFAIAALMYLQLGYKNENGQRTAAFNQVAANQNADFRTEMQKLNSEYPSKADNQLYETLFFQTKGNKDIAEGIVKALRKDRATTYGKDIVRSLLYVIPVVLLLGLFIKQRVSSTVLLAGVGLLLIIDLFSIDKRFMNEDNFVDTDQLESQAFVKTDADDEILKDTEPDFRVFNVSSGKDPFQESVTSYFHKSIGGYSPAKIGIYDDLISYQLSGTPNEQVVNMLNTKYLIQSNPQTGKPIAIMNPNRLGNSWIVKGVEFVKGPAEEMQALNHFNAKDTAIVDESFKAQIPSGIVYDSTAYLKLTKFDNDTVVYESSAATPQVGVFSEIYYPGGWNMYVDGKKSDYFKANYVLRAATIPAGKHKIEFIFEPTSYIVGYAIAKWSNILMFVLLLGGLGYGGYELSKKSKQAPAPKAKA